MAAHFTEAVCQGDATAVSALLAGGANPNSIVPCSISITSMLGNWTALHEAAHQGYSRVVQVLLAAGADRAATDSYWSMPLNRAIYPGHLAVVRLLVQAAPETLSHAFSDNWTPLEQALQNKHFRLARCLLEEGPLALLPLSDVLSRLRKARLRTEGEQVPPLYAAVVARKALTPAQWNRLPTPCDGLGTALPAVHKRAEWEAGRLVRHLPSGDRQRLRTVALCLLRVQRRWRASLPPDVVGSVVAQALMPAEVPRGAGPCSECGSSRYRPTH